MTAHRLLPPFVEPSSADGGRQTASKLDVRAPITRRNSSRSIHAEETSVTQLPSFHRRADLFGPVSEHSPLAVDDTLASNEVDDASDSGSDAGTSDAFSDDFEEEDFDLPKLLVYDLSLSIQGGECHFFDAMSSGPTSSMSRSELAPAARSQASTRKPRAASSDVPYTPSEGRVRLFSIPLPAVTVAAHQGAAEAPAAAVPEALPRSGFTSPMAAASPRVRASVPGFLGSPHAASQDGSVNRSLVQVGVSNVVYARVSFAKMDASPVVFVFLKQLVTEWQVCLLHSMSCCAVHYCNQSLVVAGGETELPFLIAAAGCIRACQALIAAHVVGLQHCRCTESSTS